LCRQEENDTIMPIDLRSHVRPGCRLAAPVILVLLAAASARAQNVGDPIDFTAIATPSILLVQTDCTLRDTARGLGGTTLFGALAPGGPPLGFLQQPAPPPIGDDPYCPSFVITVPPPGTYWLAMVYGLTTTISAPPGAWKQVVIGATCVGVPNPPLLLPGQPAISGTSVSVGFGGSPGCPPSSFLLEIGSVPGASDLGVVPLAGVAAAGSVPPGSYYVRARARNAAGTSKPSVEVPLHVPGPCVSGLPQGPINPAATVQGNIVTLSWTQTPGLPNPTFYQIRLKNPSTGQVLDNILLPPTLSVTGPVPSGSYRLQVISGNACGTTAQVTNDVFFTVP
jgi:hypothetical protein